MSKKILIIDDEIQDRKAMTIALQKAGYSQIESASSGKEGVERVKSFKPDIIIIDVVLQDADGFDLCKEIKAIEGLSAKVIIMITGHLDKVDAEKARASGADEIIEKILDFGNINRAIDNASSL